MSARDGRASIDSQTSNSPLLADTHMERYSRGGWRDVLENKMTWAWYSTISAGGGVALIIYNLPYGVRRLWVVGAAIYVASMIGFLLLLLIHAARFLVNIRLIPASIAHPAEGLFVSTFATALGILLLDGTTYSEKMHTANGAILRDFYWIFLVLALIFAIGTPLVQFMQATQMRERERDVAHGGQDLSPLAAQTVYPLLLVGPAAAIVVAHMDVITQHHLVTPIIITGVAFQGMGTLVSLLYLPKFIESLHNYSVPSVFNRPYMFLSVAPPAYTAYGFSLLAEQCLLHFPDKIVPGGGIEIIGGGVAMYYIGLTIALMFWGLAAWLFTIGFFANFTTVAHLDVGTTGLQMFSYVFPNVGFALASITLSRIFGHPKLLAVLSEILGLGIVVGWLFVIIAAMFGVFSGRMAR
ncbi:hypothetical protein RUND412_004382 [Rhizina undulata]